MDTSDLSNEAQQGILIEAEKFTRDLTLHFGVLAQHCEDEEDYLNQALELISELRTLDEDEMYDAFFGNPPDTKALNLTLDRITHNIEKVRKIPEDQRHYDF